ncbi:AEC family transporter, partial [filamentous cyanobacterium CCP5]
CIGMLGRTGLSSNWLGFPGSRRLAAQTAARLGWFLFWIGVPLSIVSFVHRADLSGPIFWAPVVAWLAMLMGLACSQFWLRSHRQHWQRPRQGSFTLASMLGNTGYMGLPVVLLLPQLGTDYFGWALLYDALGTLFGSYGLGVVIAAEFGGTPSVPKPGRWRQRLLEVVRNPTLLGFGVGVVLRPVSWPPLLDNTLYGLAWGIIMLSLVLMGMRLQQLSSWQNLRPAAIAVSIKMLLIPVVVGIVLSLVGLSGPTRLVLVLQAGMPCAFANLVLAEAYDLDRGLTVTCVGLSSVLLLLTLPIWLWSFQGS